MTSGEILALFADRWQKNCR